MTVVVVFAAMGGLAGAAAQKSSPRFGTWKLNLGKSNMTLPPKSLTRTDEPAGDGVKVTCDGIEADGSRIAYSYTAKYDGQEYRPAGVGMANGWETIALKRLDDYSWEATLKRGGKIVSSVKVVISTDGKTMTQTNGTNPSRSTHSERFSVGETIEPEPPHSGSFTRPGGQSVPEQKALSIFMM